MQFRKNIQQFMLSSLLFYPYVFTSNEMIVQQEQNGGKAWAEDVDVRNIA
jgi:hypothetical protein